MWSRKIKFHFLVDFMHVGKGSRNGWEVFPILYSHSLADFSWVPFPVFTVSTGNCGHDVVATIKRCKLLNFPINVYVQEKMKTFFFWTLQLLFNCCYSQLKMIPIYF